MPSGNKCGEKVAGKKKLVFGNWKMHGSQASIQALVTELIQALTPMTTVLGSPLEVAVFPPAPYLLSVVTQLNGSGVGCGGQDVAVASHGAFTGQVSAQMLQDVGCRYVLVGHSECRVWQDDVAVAARLLAVSSAGLVPVLCIGESLAEREAGVWQEKLTGQLQAVIDALGHRALAHCVIAYEPIWAIGTGRIPTLVELAEVYAWLPSWCRAALPQTQLACLYGGSVTADNVAELLGVVGIDGVLVGGASLKAASFAAIAQAAFKAQ